MYVLNVYVPTPWPPGSSHQFQIYLLEDSSSHKQPLAYPWRPWWTPKTLSGGICISICWAIKCISPINWFFLFHLGKNYLHSATVEVTQGWWENPQVPSSILQGNISQLCALLPSISKSCMLLQPLVYCPGWPVSVSCLSFKLKMCFVLF